MNHIKRQKGNLLIIMTLIIAALTFYLTLYADSQSKSRKKQFSIEIKQQVDNYLSALDFYGEINCNVDGEIELQKIYPDYISQKWVKPYKAKTTFSIDAGSGMRTITLKFAKTSHYESLSNLNWLDIAIAKDSNSNSITFTHGRDFAPSLGRVNYDRSLFLSKSPSNC